MNPTARRKRKSPHCAHFAGSFTLQQNIDRELWIRISLLASIHLYKDFPKKRGPVPWVRLKLDCLTHSYERRFGCCCVYFIALFLLSIFEPSALHTRSFMPFICIQQGSDAFGIFPILIRQTLKHKTNSLN